MAFWSFVGIEFACSLAEEVKQQRKAMPRGMIYGCYTFTYYMEDSEDC